MLKLNLKITAENKDTLIKLLEITMKDIQHSGDVIGTFETSDNTIDGSVIDTEAERTYWEEQAGYKLSDNQMQFIKDAEDSDLEVTLTYSGRGMRGKQCPSVSVDEVSELSSKAKYRTDSMGKGIVMYAQN
jgi:hypothetical protein